MEKQLQKLNINDVFLSVTAISDKMAYPNVITKIYIIYRNSKKRPFANIHQNSCS